MSVLIFGNNDSTTIANPIGSGDTSVTLVDVTGWPLISGDQYFVMSFFDAGTGAITEIVHVTALTGNVATIVRGQEGTAAVAWNAGDLASVQWTAGQAAAMQQIAQAQGQQANSANDSGAVNAYVATLSPAPTARVSGMPIRLLSILHTNTGASTLDVGLGASPIYGPDGSALVGGELVAGADAEFLDHSTYYQLSPVIATTTRAGILPLATNAQAIAGTDALRAIVSSSLAAVLAFFARLISPAFTGTPTAPTAATGTSTAQLATCAFVHNVIAALPPPVFVDSYQSPQESFSNGALVGPLAHGISGIPQFTTALAICISADSGYTSGQSVRLPGSMGDDGTGCSIITTSSTITLAVSSNGIAFVNPSTFARDTINPTKWKIILQAYS